MRKRMLSIWLSVCMVLTIFPLSTMAEEADDSIGMSGEIIAFAPLAETEKSVPTGKAIEDLGLPETLTATVKTVVPSDSGTTAEPAQDSGNPDNLTEATSGSALQVDVKEQQEAAAPQRKEKTVDIPVAWAAESEYDMDAEGVYVFTPVIEGYTVSAALPQIIVAVGAQPLMMALRTGTSATYGDFAVSIDEDGAAPTYTDGILTFGTAGEYTVGMADNKTSTTNRIVVTSAANITLDGVNIDVSSTENAAAFKITDTAGAVKLTIADGSVNTLKSGNYCAGLQKDTTAAGTMLTITGTGTLNATGGSRGAGIGGTAAATGGGAAGSYITISGGTVTATGGYLAAGIGGGGDKSGSTTNYGGGSGSHITISGGTVTANGGYWSAGIGGGSGHNFQAGGSGSHITISGGTVTATGGQAAAGIGAGTGKWGGTTENIVISGGNIVTTSIWNTPMNANGDNVYKTTFTVPSDTTGGTDVSTMTFTSGGTTYTYNMAGAKSILGTDGKGKVYVYLPGDSTGIAATASYDGKNYAATVKDDHAAVFAVILPHAHCVCGGSVSGGDHTEHSADIPYTKLTSTGGGLESGNYYLDSDITLGSSIVVGSGKTVNLCLNGHKLDANGKKIPVISVNTNGALNICDCKETGKITGGYGDPIMGTYFGGGIYNHGTVNFYGGSITENSVTGAGSGVMNSGTITMYGGAITKNTVTTSNSSGGAVYNTGTFTMLGGSITDNTNTAGLCAGLLHNNGTMTLSGDVQISGNAAVNNISSNLFIGNTDTPVTIASALSNIIGISYSTGAPSNYMKLLKGTDSYTLSATDLEKFSFDDTDCGRVMRLDSDNTVRLASPVTASTAANGSYTVKVGSATVPSAVKGETITVAPTASSGYELDTISVYKTGETSTMVTVTNGSFTMPDYAVTVNATFKVSSTPTYAISGTIKGSDTGAGIPASLQLQNSSGNVGNVVTAATDGSYSITDVPAGSYTIAVSYTGYDSGTITEVTVSNAAITGANLTLTKSSAGLTDAQKLAAAKTAMMAAINRMSFSNSTTAADILSVAQAASLYGVTVAWDHTNEFTKTQATASAKGSIRGTLKLTLHQESGGIGIDATIAKLSDNGGGDKGGGGGGGGGSTATPSTKPTEPVTGSTENKAAVDNKGNASVSLTDKNITDAIADAKAEAAKKDVNAGDITAVIHVTTGGKNADTVTVRLPKTTQEQVIGNKIARVQLVIDRPDLTIGMNLAAVTEINRQAKADVQLSATRMDNTKLSGDAKAAIGNRPAYDLKALYGSGKSVTDFGTGSVNVEIPYTLQEGELAGNVCAVYVDAKGKVTYLTDSGYDAKRGTVVFSTNHFSSYGVAYKASFNFTDIGGHWAKDDILFVANRGLMTGTSSTTFSPGGSMTRGMFVTALGRLANAGISVYKQSSFTDVKADAYYMGYIEWGVKNNILVGIGGGKFGPDDLVTREQMAAIMDRSATAIGCKLPEVHAQNIYADNAKIGVWAAPSVKRIQMAGIIQGKSNNLYDPQGTATRAEVSAAVRRFVELAIFSDTAQG